MKLEKRVDRENGIDNYAISISHKEADAAFARMTPFEKGMIHDMQHSNQVSTVLKVLTLWVTRIEEANEPFPGIDDGGEPPHEI